MTTDVANEVRPERHTGDRPVFSGQVVCASQLHRGERYEMVCIIPGAMDPKRFEVARVPYQYEGEELWWADIRFIDERDVRKIHPLSLEDHNILPYPNDGKWNQSNYIRAAEGSSNKFLGDPLGKDCPCRPYHP